jgi:hypothetical protein
VSRYIDPIPQYTLDNGDPVPSGKLYFYESGSNTAKTTYADVNLSIANTNPVILRAAGRVPNIFFNGTAKVKLTDSDDVQIFERDPVGDTSTTGNFSTWNSLSIYNTGTIVTGSDGNFYVSITNGNQNSDPTTTPADWSQIRFIRVWNTLEAYTIDQVVEGTDGLLYTCVIANTGNDPVTDAVNWKPSTTIDVPAVVLAGAKTYAYNSF